MSTYSDGFYAGLANERENPHSIFSYSWMPWYLGNSAGLDVHCAIVEAVYLRESQ